MDKNRVDMDRSELPVPKPAAFQPLLFVLAVLLASIVGYVVGGLLPWAWTETIRISPFILASLVIGWFLGATWLQCTRMFEIGNRLTVTVGFWIVVLIGVLSPHRIAFDQSYEATLRQIEMEARHVSRQASGLSPGEIVAAMTHEMLPDGVWDFLNRSAVGGRKIGPWTIYDGWVWGSWLIDSLVLVFGAILAAHYVTRRIDFCGGCGRFYRRIADGKTTLARLQSLVEQYDLPVKNLSSTTSSGTPDGSNSSSTTRSAAIPNDSLIDWYLHACPSTCGNGILRYRSELRRRTPPDWIPSLLIEILAPWFRPVLSGKVYLDAETTVILSQELRSHQPLIPNPPEKRD